MGCRHDQIRREGGPPGGAPLGAKQRVRVGRVVLHLGGRRGGDRGSAVLLGERVPVGQDGVRGGGKGGTLGCAQIPSIEGVCVCAMRSISSARFVRARFVN